jgi:D-psicose/D-tagatose/L-ribulose 3-epimerase
MRIALCNEVIAPMPFPAQCEYAAKLGYDGLEVAPYTLSDEPQRMGAAQIAVARAAAEEAGIAVTGLHWLLVKPAGLSISTKDAAVRKRTLDVMYALVDLCAALGGRYLVHGSPQQRRLEAGETRVAATERARMLRRGGRARATGRRRLLRRAARAGGDAAHQHAR